MKGMKKLLPLLVFTTMIFCARNSMAQNYFGNDSAKVYSMMPYSFMSCPRASFDFYKDNTFLFSLCDSGCLCIRGNWTEINSHIILRETKRAFNCSSNRPVSELQQKFIPPFDDSIYITASLSIDESGKGHYGDDNISLKKWRKKREVNGIFRKEYYSILKPVNIPRETILIPGKWLHGYWHPENKEINAYIEKKYNVKIIDYELSKREDRRSYRKISRGLLFDAILFDLEKALHNMDNNEYNNFKRVCNCYTP